MRIYTVSVAGKAYTFPNAARALREHERAQELGGHAVVRRLLIPKHASRRGLKQSRGK